MTEQFDLSAEIQRMLALLDADEYPQIYHWLWEHSDNNVGLEEDEYTVDSPYQMADAMLSMDRPKPLSPLLIDFITDLYLSEIEQGNDNAMNDLGSVYYDGHRGFEQSFEKAVHYYHMAAQHGNRQAQENLGYCYYYGRMGRPDYEKAFHYFALGAFDGHLISLYKIGDMYFRGLYVQENKREAYHIYTRCLETMTKTAEGRVAGPVYLRLGQMYLDGAGTKQNSKNALICFQKAESFLFDMVMAGDAMYRRSLDEAIRGQAKARKLLAEELPEDSWLFDR